jgi:peptidoglycan/LPS O-acetylase OafA/YrhL
MNIRFKNFYPSVTSIKRINFRRDITGLRAISVIGVVFYHVDFDLIKGGWLGVDVFFVISGFLISNIIISELNQGIFSFKNFYLRRIKRILPVFMSTLLFLIPFAYNLLLPDVLIQFSKSLIASLFFYANIYFSNLDFYNTDPSKFNPLMHTWSLSIEEQFYIFFPLLIFLIYKYIKKYTFVLISFVTLISMFSNLFSQSTDKFYLIQFRAWEMLLGCLLMFISTKVKLKKLKNFGFIIMILPFFLFDDSYVNNIEPKIIALFGVSIFILGENNNSIVSRFLNLGFIQNIGLISYSMYLIHQPLFSFYRVYLKGRFLSIKTDEILLLLIILYIISNLSYKYIELPSQSYKYTIRLILVTSSLLIIFSFFIIQTNGFDKRYSIENAALLEYYNEQRLGVDKNFCTTIEGINLKFTCFTPSLNNDKKYLLIIGDSHLETVSKYLFDERVNAEYGLLTLTEQGCPFILPNKENSQASCATSEKFDEVNFIIERFKPVIVIGGRLPWYYNGKSFQSNLGSTKDDMTPGGNQLLFHIQENIDYLQSVTDDLIIIHPIPELGIFPLESYLGGYYKLDEPLFFDMSYWVEYSYKITELLESNIKAAQIRTDEIFCDSFVRDKCTAVIDGTFFYYDDDHLTYDGAKLIGKEILKILQEK